MLIGTLAKYWPASIALIDFAWWYWMAMSCHLDVHGIKVPGSEVASKFTISVFAFTQGHKTEKNKIEKNVSGGLNIVWYKTFSSPPRAPNKYPRYLEDATATATYYVPRAVALEVRTNNHHHSTQAARLSWLWIMTLPIIFHIRITLSFQGQVASTAGHCQKTGGFHQSRSTTSSQPSTPWNKAWMIML